MDGLSDYIRNMTFWNWLALIAFIFLPLSALNAFFSLKSRYSNWRAIKSKKNFSKRLEEIELYLTEVQQYRNQPLSFIIEVLEKTVRVFGLFLCASLGFLASFILFNVRLLNTKFPYGSGLFIATISYGLLAFCFYLTVKLFRFIRTVKNPSLLVKTVKDLVSKAATNDVITDDDLKRVITSLITLLFAEATF